MSEPARREPPGRAPRYPGQPLKGPPMLRLLFCLVLAACAAPADADPRAGFTGEPMEPILNWSETSRGVAVTVRSNGCTQKDDFDPVVTGSPSQGWAFDLELVRLEPDNCRAHRPEGETLEWTREELFVPASAELRVVNPVRGD